MQSYNTITIASLKYAQSHSYKCKSNNENLKFFDKTC